MFLVKPLFRCILPITLIGGPISATASTREKAEPLAMQTYDEQIQQGQLVEMIYTNWRGEKAARRIIPIRLFFGATEWHPEEQWLLEAYDLEKQAMRAFAMKQIEQWQAAQ